MKHPIKYTCRLLLGFFLFLFIIQTQVLYTRASSPKSCDISRITLETYDSMMISMFPTSRYPLQIFKDYRGMTVLNTEFIVPDLITVYEYLEKSINTPNNLSTVFLGIRPDKTSIADVARLTESYPQITFEIITACPYQSYWRDLQEYHYRHVLEQYQNFLQPELLPENAHLYFFTSLEWLITNPSLYVNEWLMDYDASRFLAANCYSEYPYLVSPINKSTFAQSLALVTRDIRKKDLFYPDLSDLTIVFFGDSIIGNFTDGMSIPGVVEGLTDAKVYNCGLGGTCASQNKDNKVSLPDVVSAFFTGDTQSLPQNTQLQKGISEYHNTADKNKKTCFIINFGINDYFTGIPPKAPDPYDIKTYFGALHTAVSTIQKNRPEAQIIICTPNYISVQIANQLGTRLQDYADVVLTYRRFLSADIVDQYYQSGIDENNSTSYLSDGVHPNETARFMMAKKIIEAIH